jgi:hypothetical protein
MKDLLMICLRQESIACWRVSGNKVIAVLQFPVEPQPLFAWLKNFSGVGIHLLLDLAEEEVYIDNSPMLFPWEQTSFATRQLRKRFPKTDFCHYRFDTNKALPWESRSGFLLTSGFNDDVSLIKLLSWLEVAKTPVLSIHSLGLLLPSLFSYIWFSHRTQHEAWAEKPHFLLTRTGRDSFRQILIVNGELRTIRQIQLRDQATMDQMQQLLQEIRLLDKFVHTQKMIAYDQTPDLYYLGSNQEDSEAAWQVFQHSPYGLAGRSAFMSVASLMPQTIDQTLVDDILPVLAFGQRNIAGNYFPKVVLDSKQYRQFQQGLWLSLLVIVIVFFGYAITFAVKTMNSDIAMNSLQQQHTRYQALVHQLQSQLHLDVPVDQLKLSVEFVDHVHATTEKQDSLPYFLDLSDVLENYPTIHLSDLAWLPSTDNQQPDNKMDTTAFSLHLSAVITADANTRLRQVMDKMDHFLSDLKNQPSIKQVTLLKKPIDLDSSRPLSIKAEDTIETVQSYPFELTLTFKAIP